MRKDGHYDRIYKNENLYVPNLAYLKDCDEELKKAEQKILKNWNGACKKIKKMGLF